MVKNIIDFFSKNIFELKLFGEKNSSELESKYKQVKSAFDEKHQNNTGINEETFPNNTSLLLAVRAGSHLLYAKREDDRITLSDPTTPIIKEFTSLKAFIAGETKLNAMPFTKEPSLFGYSEVAFSLFRKKPIQQIMQQEKNNSFIPKSN